MFYIVGDIHGQYYKLIKLIKLIEENISPDDIIIFLGDYIDRGEDSCKVIEYLADISVKYNSCFLKGNHEDMFLNYYITGRGYELYIRNGGMATILSYTRELGDMKLPEKHKDFFNSLKLFYEGDDFIAVHAGLNPQSGNPDKQDRDNLLWIREDFFLANFRWKKTVIFGHTPTPFLNNSDIIYTDERRNIIGIDTGAMYDENPLTCLRWPDRTVFRAFR
jgi:serine/threonine protein phosphatase 1